MGAHFQLQHANVVAYLTTPTATPPRLREKDLSDFLLSLSESRHWEPPPFMSHDQAWPDAMYRKAKFAYIRFDRDGEDLVEEAEIMSILSDLRDAFSRFDFFALLVGANNEHDPATALARHFAFATGTDALVLLPIRTGATDPMTVMDPIPAFALAMEQRQNWPGILFWSRTGVAAFAPIDDASEIFQALTLAARRNGLRTGELDDVLRAYEARRGGVRLLHLSDLHYGRREAVENQALLLAQLDRELDEIHRVVITGDLFDNPTRSDAIQFRNFRADLVRRTGKDPVVIPGNHDQKWLGNLKQNLRQVADLEWSRLVVDDDLRCVFFCFDSSKDADLARGRVTVEQLRDVATDFETAAVRNREIRDYLPVALVHHHPFSFEVKRETQIQKFLGRFGLSDERFIRMLDADQFLGWIAKRRIPLILHGHKHVQRQFSQAIDTGHAWQYVSAVGCGTSLGAENYPLSYNIITWDQRTRSWTASFYADPGDGSGFTRQCITTQALTTEMH